MGGCYSLLPNRAKENPVNGQPQQPGTARRAVSLCQSIRDFFMEYFYSRWSNGAFGKSMLIAKTKLMKAALPNEADGNVIARRKNEISLIETHNPENKKSDPLGETKTSLDQVKLSNAREVITTTATKEQENNGASALNPNAGTGVEGSEVAGNNGADDSVV